LKLTADPRERITRVTYGRLSALSFAFSRPRCALICKTVLSSGPADKIRYFLSGGDYSSISPGYVGASRAPENDSSASRAMQRRPFLFSAFLSWRLARLSTRRPNARDAIVTAPPRERRAAVGFPGQSCATVQRGRLRFTSRDDIWRCLSRASSCPMRLDPRPLAASRRALARARAHSLPLEHGARYRWARRSQLHVVSHVGRAGPPRRCLRFRRVSRRRSSRARARFSGIRDLADPSRGSRAKFRSLAQTCAISFMPLRRGVRFAL